MLRFVALLFASLAAGAPSAPAHARLQAPAAQVPATPATSPRAGSPDNPLLARWAGPFGGVPPWDAVKPELFPPAFAAALAEERVEVAAIAAPSRATHLREHHRRPAARRPDTGSPRATVRRHDDEHELAAIQALDREWSPKLAAASDEIAFNDELFARIEAVLRRWTRAALAPEQQRLTALDLRPLRAAGAKLDARSRRRSSGRSTRSSPGCSPTSATRCSPTRTPGSCSRARADLAGLPASLRRRGQGRRRRAQARRQVGGRQHALERRSVPDRSRPAATCARRSGRRSRAAATTATRTTPTRRSRAS